MHHIYKFVLKFQPTIKSRLYSLNKPFSQIPRSIEIGAAKRGFKNPFSDDGNNDPQIFRRRRISKIC